MEAADQRHAGNYKDTAHDKRADDAPEQYRALLLRRNLEILKEQDEDKQIINTERFFNEIAGNKFQRLPCSHPVMNQAGKGQSQRDPAESAEQRLLESNNAPPTIEHREIQQQQHQNAGVKNNPERDTHLNMWKRHGTIQC